MRSACTVAETLLSNAFKFTHQEKYADGGPCADGLETPRPRISTGAGRHRHLGPGHRDRHHADKQQIIFEASSRPTAARAASTAYRLGFHQSELARLLGARSGSPVPRAGSTFTLYLPLIYIPRAARARRSSGRSTCSRCRCRAHRVLAADDALLPISDPVPDRARRTLPDH